MALVEKYKIGNTTIEMHIMVCTSFIHKFEVGEHKSYLFFSPTPLHRTNVRV